MKPWKALTWCLSSTMKKRPVLRGVVLDMDGTLTVPNIDFVEMYRQCQVDPKEDILKVLAGLTIEEAAPKYKIIEDIEDEAIRTMQLMPGAFELMNWLRAHHLPTALVTRNTLKSAKALQSKLGNFDVIIARDSHPNMLPKPSPAAITYIQNKWKITDASSIIMIGDSPANDIAFGKGAGTCTALLDTGRKYFDANKSIMESADIIVDMLWQLPHQLWLHFDIDGDLGTHMPLKTYDAPTPSSPTTRSIVQGIIENIDESALHEPGDTGNTPLIWAANSGHKHVVQFLLQDSSASVDVQGYLGNTALSRAARHGHAHIVKMLIDAGANPNIGNNKMQYPLHFAAFKEHMSVVQVLLTHKHLLNMHVVDRKGRIPADDTKNENIRRAILEAMQ